MESMQALAPVRAGVHPGHRALRRRCWPRSARCCRGRSGWFYADGDGAADFERQKQYAAFTALYNVTGQPAVSVPLFWTDDGLPIGAMLVGRPADEATLIALSAQLETARPWAQRHPPGWELPG